MPKKKSTPTKRVPLKRRIPVEDEDSVKDARSGEDLDGLIEELKSNRELFYQLSTDPDGTVETIESLNENQKLLLRMVNPSDLIRIGFKGPGAEFACGASCGASCGGSCAGSCAGSCGGSCGASCAGSCVASCIGSCAASCVASGLMPPSDDWISLPDEGNFDDVFQLTDEIVKQQKQFATFFRG